MFYIIIFVGDGVAVGDFDVLFSENTMKLTGGKLEIGFFSVLDDSQENLKKFCDKIF